MLVVPNTGEVLQIEAALGKVPAAVPFSVRLFTNNKTPASSDTETNYVEASGGGYAAIVLNASNWTTTPGAPAASVQPQQTFAFAGPLDGGASIFGYYVTDATGALLWAERRSAGSFTPANAGDLYKVTPRFTLGSVSGD